MNWKQWQKSIAHRLGLKLKARLFVREEDCSSGSLVVDAKYRRLPRWFLEEHSKTMSYASPWQLPLTIYHTVGPDALVVMDLRDFERFCLPCFETRRQRGWAP